MPKLTLHGTREILKALIGTKVRIAGDEDGYVAEANLRALGFGDDDIYAENTCGKRSEKCQQIIETHYTISHVELSTSGTGIYIGIKEFGDDRPQHHIERFELAGSKLLPYMNAPQIEPEPRTKHCLKINLEFSRTYKLPTNPHPVKR